MGATVSRTDFDWSYSEEPHKSRREHILAKYPQVKKLMVSDPTLVIWVTVMVILQVIAATLLRDASWVSIIIAAYVFGGTVNHSMTLAIHEISHNLAFGHAHPLKNKLLGIFGNFPLGIPYAITFKKYHLEHHKYQGDESIDMDLPCDLEGKLFHNTGTKVLWLLLQPFFYALRPVIKNPKPLTKHDVWNIAAQLTFDAIIVYTLGYKSLIYLCIGTFMAMGLHPVAGHFISEHYVFVKGYETYSYYGMLNFITFNVGYHNEHHDFPNIPGRNLPKLKAMAPEFYDHLPCHNSWVKVLYDFVMDPDISPYARIKRNPKKQLQNGNSVHHDYNTTKVQ